MAGKLRRKLGFWTVFCIAAGAMISSGLFVLPALAFEYSGPAVVLSYALAALMVVPALLAQSELATAMPRSGGSYFFVERSMGALPGTLAGLAGWFSVALKSAFAMVGIGAFARLLWQRWGLGDLDEAQWTWLIRGVAIVCCGIFVALNVLSVKLTGRVQVALVGLLLAALASFVLWGSPHVEQHPHFDRFLAKRWDRVFATAGLVFVSFGGLTKVAGVAGEIRRPGRSIPRAMVLAWVVVSLLYVAAVFVMVGVLRPGELVGPSGASLTPLSDAGEAFGGAPALAMMSAAAILAFVTTGNSGVLSASRVPLAMSRDDLLPAALGRVSRRFGTPVAGIGVTGAFMVLMIALLDVGSLVKVASTMMLILFLLINVSVLVMRGSGLQNYRPLYRMPGVPWLPAAGIVTYAALIVLMARAMSGVPLITTAAFVAAGALWYVLYVRPRASRESALVYMVRSVVSREIYRSTLEAELREIAIERDEVTHDRFDRLVRGCAILDLAGPMSGEELLSRAAEALAERLPVGPDRLLELLRRREAASSTVIRPGVAVPHVVIEGEDVFEMLLVRCKAGARFGGHDEPVQVVFVLAGSPDRRNEHLRALVAIAHIIQEHEFTRRWLAAADSEHLRDILLLSTRERDRS